MAVADNGKEALERLSAVAEEKAEGYDVILMDVEMPSECITSYPAAIRTHCYSGLR
jgi:CheY-like chemotaxis protein